MADDDLNQAQPRFARGGHVPGAGKGDTVPVVLEPGLTVFARTATDEDLEALENMGLRVDAERLRKERDGL